jgi:hypothetical protein
MTAADTSDVAALANAEASLGDVSDDNNVSAERVSLRAAVNSADTSADRFSNKRCFSSAPTRPTPTNAVSDTNASAMNAATVCTAKNG